MSDDMEDNILENVFESQRKSVQMGNLQYSINKSMEYTRNNTPSFQKGETKSTNHLIFEMNEFYIEMADKLKELNLTRYDSIMDEGEDDDVEDTDSVLYEVVDAIRKKRNDPEIRKQIETVLNLDKLMEDTYKTLKEEKKERLEIQKELCDLIEQEDEKYAKSRVFKNLCDLEAKKLNSSKINQLAEEDDNIDHIPVKLSKSENKFIKRNIELAKNTPTMYNSTCSLTDEEKIKLDKLLSDIDKINEPVPKESSISLGTEEDDDVSQLSVTSVNYPFSISQDDRTRLQELDTELESISEVSLLPSKEKSASRSQDEWLNKDRLKQINEKLEKLQSERETFQYVPKEVSSIEGLQETHTHLDEETIDGVDSLSYDTIHARSMEMLKHIANIVENHHNSTQVEELEHQEKEEEGDEEKQG